MPLTRFQREIARALARNRSPESHVAGGAVINRGEETLRFSNDLDIFHDRMESVESTAETDAEVLRSSGYELAWDLRTAGFFRASVSRAGDLVLLEWSADSAFRFFPAVEDDDFGFCLHAADLATNKVLALVGRIEIRDYLDIYQIDRSYLSLGAMIWAACGKDLGFTPDLLLNQANRHSRHRDVELTSESLAREMDIKGLKSWWIDSRDRAEELFRQLPPAELGCLYLDSQNRPVTPDPSQPDFPALTRHFGSIRGAWPTIS